MGGGKCDAIDALFVEKVPRMFKKLYKSCPVDPEPAPAFVLQKALKVAGAAVANKIQLCTKKGFKKLWNEMVANGNPECDGVKKHDKTNEETCDCYNNWTESDLSDWDCQVEKGLG